jgi:hypothetical protein
MDFTKFPLEKLLFFVAGVIPGFVALLIFGLAHPAAFNWFFVLGFLGYKTKLCLILLVAFVVGNSLTTFFGTVFGRNWRGLRRSGCFTNHTRRRTPAMSHPGETPAGGQFSRSISEPKLEGHQCYAGRTLQNEVRVGESWA